MRWRQCSSYRLCRSRSMSSILLQQVCRNLCCLRRLQRARITHYFRSDGKVLSVGYGGYYELGTSSTYNTSPQEIPNLSNVLSVASGGNFASYALRQDPISQSSIRTMMTAAAKRLSIRTDSKSRTHTPQVTVYQACRI